MSVIQCDIRNFFIKLPDTRTPWVKLPKELGGKKVNVIDEFIAKSCKCCNHQSRILILDCDYMCIECSLNLGFMWFKKPTDIESFKLKLK